VIIDSLKLPVAKFGEDGEHVERAAVAHVQMVGLLVVLAGSPIVGGTSHLLLVAGQVPQAQQVFLSRYQGHSAYRKIYCTNMNNFQSNRRIVEK
jgi:hypothetical protein